jgi:hypothetical protein
LDANAQFRITVWPGQPVPLPRYRRVHCRLSEARDALLFTYERDGLAEPGGETYLELYNLDLDNPEEILAFASRNSVLRGEELFRRLRAANFFDRGVRERESWNAAFRKWHRPVYDRANRERLFDENERVLESVETLFEFRFTASLLHNMTSSWRLLSTGADPKSLPWLGRDSANYFDARRLMNTVLPLLLGNYSPVVEVSYPKKMKIGQRPAIAAGFPGSSAPLYETCAFELFNHIGENAIYLTCQNETCKGRPLFVRQSGRRSELGMSKLQGVMYCDAACARAQAQRAYRRRKAVKRRQT